MAATTTAPRFVGDARSVRGTSVRELQAFLDRAVGLSQAAYLFAMRRAVVRRALHRFARDHQLDRARSSAHAGDAPTCTLLRQLLRLWRAGASPAELYRIAAMPLRAIEALVGDAPRSLDVIDPEEQRLDGLEDELQMRRRIQALRPQGMNPADLREEAALCASAAVVYREREQALLREADRIERAAGMVA